MLTNFHIVLTRIPRKKKPCGRFARTETGNSSRRLTSLSKNAGFLT